MEQKIRSQALGRAGLCVSRCSAPNAKPLIDAKPWRLSPPRRDGLVRELDFREHISKSWLFVSFVLRQKKGKPMHTRTRPLTQNLHLNMRLQTIC
ncbi:MAG: hypothetical protein RL660_1080 [Bacteroidota bacterium]|jgi:hypothetical protein